MRGRWPSGLEYIDKLEGTVESKERLKAVLETLHGQARLLEACAQLQIGETRFHQLRETALQGALTALEARPAVLKLAEHGLIGVAAGKNVVRFLPPLNITRADVDEAVEKVGRAFGDRGAN